MSKLNDLAKNKSIDNLADQCVKCGLCLPHCPTYDLTGDESESPRGRIALMQALAKKELEPSKKVVDHLEHCLSCRHCERVCPAHVKYGELLNLSRSALQQTPGKPIRVGLKTKLLSKIVQSRRSIVFAGQLLWIIQRSGLRHITRWTGITKILGLSPMDKLLPPVPSQKAFHKEYQSLSPEIGTISLFLGCLSRWCDRETAQATIFALNYCGYKVVIPKDQGCCGAMAMHQGHEEVAQSLISKNIKVFKQTSIDKIVTTASGCASMLKESHQHLQDEQYRNFSDRITDISHFILDKIDTNKLTNLDIKVALHTPCTLKNGMRESESAIQLLKLIPKLESFSITEKDTCCGSAGSYMIENPIWATKLVNKVLNELNELKTNVDYIATSNIGCALHLRQALNLRKQPIKVVHPIVLLAMSLGWKAKSR